ncbi:hypothetical protein BJX61DRAFT_538922 [Aspergillus egyptiacus]|nr:hypothetical protein BJX61DRAFT_538922 [Aspergillus egyptiacus]
MKIIIIGGGISGCAAYLQLKKHLPTPPSSTQHDITIYESHDTSINATHEQRDGETYSSTLIIGGGLGVLPNGLNVLKRLDEGLLRDIVCGGYAIASQNLRSKNGTLLVRIDPTAVDEDGKLMHLLGISRHSLWWGLRTRIPDRDMRTKKVSRVVAREDGRNEVHFADGSPFVEADLVIGADGVKGVSKLALLSEADEVDLYKPIYQGLVGVGGFISTEEVQSLVEEGSMNLVFGGNGFFGYFFSEIVAQLRERHAHWKDPVIQRILGSLEVKNMFPTWTSPQLPMWERDGVVLIGDAAHALPSTSGQGSSQALEDAEAFVMLLCHWLRLAYQEPLLDAMAYKRAITMAAKQYEEIRRPRVQSILENAQRMQNTKRSMGVIAEYCMYCAMWLAGRFTGLMSRPLQRVNKYNIAEEVKAFIERQTR